MDNHCNNCLDKDLRMQALELRNRFLKQRIDTLESISFFSWLTWFFFGERTEMQKPLNKFNAD